MLRTALLRASIVVLAAWGGPALASCVAPGGAGGCFATIQAAITAAAQGETIDVAAGTFTDAFTVDGSARLTIRGAGVGATVLDGSTLGTYPIAGITNNARVALEDMTLQNGTGYIGGAITIGGGRVTVSRCRITGNNATGGSGGAINVYGGTLTVVDTTLDGNAVPGGGFGGGAIFVDKGNIELRRSTVSGNVSNSLNGGGGVYLSSNGRMLVVDSTLSGNTASQAAAVACYSCRGLRLVSTTVTGNTSTSSSAFYPGAVMGVGPRGMTWSNSIVAGNSSAVPGAECSGQLRSRGYDLIGGAGMTAATIGCEFVKPVPTDIIGVDPMLGPLADNGGPTRTHALLVGSPAIDAADPRPPADRAMRCPTTDQRGMARNGRCDIGAFEF